jgi:YHS domain-containing protein
MKKIIFFMLILSWAFSVSPMGWADQTAVSSTEANIWITKDGQKHFTCPVMGSEGIVTSETPFSIVDGKKFYHCCNGCSEKLTADPAKYLSKFTIPANVVTVDKKGDHFQCPVSGEIGIVDAKTKFADVDGKRYYFCCSKCETAFAANPQKFLPAKPTAGAKLN